MARLLHIIATPRGAESRTLRISKSYVEKFRSEDPDGTVDELDLFKEGLPAFAATRAKGKYVIMGGGKLEGTTRELWREVEGQIERFLRADVYLVSAPMWNFSIPYVLKQYIDLIVQPGYLFKYGPKGPEGLAKGKKMVVVTTRGGDYGPDSPFKAMDFQEPYLKGVFGFVGITDLTFVHGQPADAGGPKLGEKRIRAAVEAVKKLPVSTAAPARA